MKTRVPGHLVAGCALGGWLLLAVPAGAVDGKLGEGNPDGKLTAKPIEQPAMFDPKIAEYYQQALSLTRNRQYDEAEVYCRRILAIKTNELNTVQLMRDIAARRLRDPGRDPRGLLKQKLETIILPEFKTVDAVARDAVVFLQQQSAKYTADKTPVNLVWDVPAGHKVPLITLSLYQVPMAEALRYLADTAGLAVRYDDTAVVIEKPGPPPAVAEGFPTTGFALRKKLKETVVPEFRVSEMPARDAVTHLQTLGGQAAADRTPVNVVWTVPADHPVPAVTLVLYKIPLANALQYVAELSGLRYTVDERAVVITAPAPPLAATTQP